MNDRKYIYTLYIIIAVILSTIIIQGYWNYKNYVFNKQQLIKDIQISLDKAVDDYYSDLAQKTTLGFKFEGDAQKDAFKEGGFFDEVTASIDEGKNEFKDLHALKVDSVKGITVFRGLRADSLMKEDKEKHFPNIESKEIHKWLKKDEKADSSDIKNVGLLISKVLVSVKYDSLNVKKVDSLINADLERKNIAVDYHLDFKEEKKRFPKLTKVTEEKQEVVNEDIIKTNLLHAKSKSTFLPKNSTLTIYYENINWSIFKRIFSSLIISAFLVLAVIGCLFYLLKIIKNQKQLAEVKNDLISNITHEFKTPIATIGVAIESIKNFNVLDDKEKTKTYLDMSNNQLSKLNVMVEKLLETATLDSDSLKLEKENYNIAEILYSIVEKHKIQTKKAIQFTTTSDKTTANVDVFHFENAVNNILDNAIKYGGNTININLSQNSIAFTVSISDDGNSLTKANKDKIFEKFYRVPKGNTHDVKGFGIGLYYAKIIAEKHGGTMHLDFENNQPTFKMSLPNE